MVKGNPSKNLRYDVLVKGTPYKTREMIEGKPKKPLI